MQMRPALAAFVLALASAAPANAQTPAPDPALAALPATMVRAVMAGDAAALRSHCASSSVVIDEFPPYVWAGDDACVRWLNAFKRLGATNVSGTVQPSPFIDVNGQRAYVSARVRLNATFNGAPMQEEGTWTFVLAKSAAGWKITSLAWGTMHH